MSTISIEVNDITAILERKVKAFEEFLSVSELLCNELGNEKMREVSACIERREELIRNIDDMDRLIALQRNSVTGVLDPIRDSQAVELFRRLQDTLRRIMPIDQECGTRAVSRSGIAQRELILIHQHDRGLQTYVQKKERLPRFLNVQT